MSKKKLEDFFTELQNREIVANYANLENFLSLEEKERCVYLGIDCTSENLHIGHLLQIIQVIRFSLVGFQTFLVLGGATSKIGDPSDKSKERPQLSKEKINDYHQQIKKQIIETFLNRKSDVPKLIPLEMFYSDNPNLLINIHRILKLEIDKPWEKYWQYVLPLNSKTPFFQILNNDDWSKELNFIDFIDIIGRKISVNYLLAKETIKQRVNSKTGLSFLAFSYSLLQAYDFYYLHKKYNCNGQLGGSDQWGNITTGLKLIHNYYPQNKTFALTFSLLLDKEGRKISKTGNQKTIWLDSKKTSFKEFHDFFSNMDDKQAIIYIRKFTFISEKQLQELLILNNPPKLRILQRVLLELMFYLLYQKEGVDHLKVNFSNKNF